MTERPRVAFPLLSTPQEPLSHLPEHPGTGPKKTPRATAVHWVGNAGACVSARQRDGAKINRKADSWEMRTKSRGPQAGNASQRAAGREGHLHICSGQASPGEAGAAQGRAPHKGGRRLGHRDTVQ